MSFLKLKELYFLKKNKPVREIKHFYNDLNLIWTNCFEYNEDNSEISNEASKLRKLANKLIKEKILSKENESELDSDDEELDVKRKAIKAAKTNDKRGRSASSASIFKKQLDESKDKNKNNNTLNDNKKKAKFQTSSNLSMVMNDRKEDKNKFKSSKNLKTVEIKEDFKTPNLKNSKAIGNKVKHATENDKEIKADNRPKSESKKESKTKTKKIINDDSMEDSIEKINEFDVKNVAGGNAKGTDESKNDAVPVITDTQTPTQKPTENKSPTENIINELNDKKEETPNEETSLGASTKQQEEPNEARKLDDSIEIKKINFSQDPPIIIDAINKMDVEEGQVPIESQDNIVNQIPADNEKNSDINENEENKEANFNEVEHLSEATGNQMPIEPDIKETPHNSNDKAEIPSGAVANEIEMGVEQELQENKNPISPQNENPNDNKTLITTENDDINKLNNEMKRENNGKRRKSKTNKSLGNNLYGKDLAHDAVRFNNRVGTDKKEKEELSMGDIYHKSYKRTRKEINYKICDSFKKPSTNKKQQNLLKEEKTEKNQNKHSTNDTEKDKDSAKNLKANSSSNNVKNKKLADDSCKSDLITKKVNNETIDLNEDESNDEELEYNKKKKSNKLKKKANKDSDKEDSENEGVIDSKVKRGNKSLKKEKGKSLNLSLEEEEEKIKREKDAESESESEEEIR